jgi:hypothetical protein
MPDLKALAAQAASMPVGAGAGVKFVTPKDSMLQFSVDGDGKAQSRGLGGPAICGFAIPLITIVATFVLRLFLPIVVFLFGLWWMLRLRFCIPPVLQADTSLTSLLVGRINQGQDLDDPQGKVKAALVAHLGPDISKPLVTDGYPMNVLGKLVVDLSTDLSVSAPTDLADAVEPSEDHRGAPGRLPSPTEDLEYWEYQSPVEVPSS